MKTLSKTASLSAAFAVLGLFMVNTASAAPVPFVDTYKTIYQTSPSGDSTIEKTDGSPYLEVDPDYAYILTEAKPSAVDAVQLQLAFDVAAGTGNYPELVGYEVTGFESSEGFGSGLEGIFVGNVTELTDDWFRLDLSGIPMTFEGFMMKSGDLTFVALFDEAISTLDFKSFVKQGISHIAIFNGGVSEVPVPAALFMFAPALAGFMGLRRRAKNTVA